MQCGAKNAREREADGSQKPNASLWFGEKFAKGTRSGYFICGWMGLEGTVCHWEWGATAVNEFPFTAVDNQILFTHRQMVNLGWDEKVAKNCSAVQKSKVKNARDGTGERARAEDSLPNAGDEQVNVSPNTMLFLS